MERLAINELLKWKNKQYRKPLIIEGARQVGKIYLSDNIDNVLTTISLLYSTDYRKEERTIFISENP